MQVALFGNPNTGKTSLFNELTGSYEYVGNWTGVTVEKKVGRLKKNLGLLIDLPGIYALNPLSKDEAVASNFLIEEEFTSILNIVDASQLARNLHLTIQLMEYGKPVLIGLNMIDVAKSRGMKVDEKSLSKGLGVPVVPIIARTGKGCGEISERMREKPVAPDFRIDYGDVIEEAATRIMGILPDYKSLNKRWLALQFLEGNEVIRSISAFRPLKTELLAYCTEVENRLREKNPHASLKQEMFKKRQQFIDRLIGTAVEQTGSERKTLTEKIDAVVSNKFLGVPIFIGTMYLMFCITFNWLGTPLSDLLDKFFSGPLTDWIEAGLTKAGATQFIRDVVLNGIVAGVGGVLVFVPQIFVLFFFISLIEDSGYMARVAMVMDRVMEAVGLNGRAFIPLIIGFGCNVPGVMASRPIEQPKERLLTTLLTPLMSCSARLSVYSLFVSAFFHKYQALVVLSLYLLGIVIALVLAKVFSMVMKTEGSVFIIELPPYRVPNARSLFRGTWDKGKGFVRKAGTLIFGGTVVIWLISYTGPGGLDVPVDKSFMALICKYLAPLFQPLGFGTWQAAAALLTGFMAKEVVVSTMNVLYFVPSGASLADVIQHAFTPLTAYSFMVFILLYIPCLSTVAMVHKETGSGKVTLFSIGYALTVAYVVSFIIYQGGRLLGF
ncbi:ferrous iron transport protein B [Weizmannia acidilactici]|uniref:ferrous iron transport protein B n=1 Tax=Weizmannia acidilactici TaxID=2607726 RepID=UPI00124C7DC8|nr:ferrous iron transport protein B [Weizmannia acidilactici]GER73880.1 ferrous iron transport protein B [Weizmannia acidilactici]